jgi:hypothetical protein
MEIPGEPRAAQEIAMLWEYLYRRLTGEHRTLLASDSQQVTPNSADPDTVPVSVP